jgi:hypothetical protein
MRRRAVDPLAVEPDLASRGRSSPMIVLSVVDLPAPFDPMSVTISPLLDVIEMPFRAWMLP